MLLHFKLLHALWDCCSHFAILLPENLAFLPELCTVESAKMYVQSIVSVCHVGPNLVVGSSFSRFGPTVCAKHFYISGPGPFLHSFKDPYSLAVKVGSKNSTHLCRSTAQCPCRAKWRTDGEQCVMSLKLWSRRHKAERPYKQT